MADSLQIKLSMDKGLKTTWDYLSDRYGALDKASIIRLALNELAKEAYKAEKPTSLNDLLNEIDRNNLSGPTEDEFFEWWNEHKKTI